MKKTATRKERRRSLYRLHRVRAKRAESYRHATSGRTNNADLGSLTSLFSPNVIAAWVFFETGRE